MKKIIVAFAVLLGVFAFLAPSAGNAQTLPAQFSGMNNEQIVAILVAQIQVLMAQVQALMARGAISQSVGTMAESPSIANPPTAVPPVVTTSTQSVNLTVASSGFSPSQFNVRAGQTVTITLASGDGETHVLRFNDPSLSIVTVGVGPGDSSRFISFTAPTNSGNYAFYCDVPGHETRGETGTMVVTGTTSTTTTPSITVLSPNGGETYKAGDTVDFRWKSSGLNRISINLDNVKTGYRYGTNISGNLNANVETVSWTVESQIPAGKYKVAMYGYNTDNNLSASDSSDDYFSIISSTVSGVPTISGVSGPQSLNIGQTGTWTVQASDSSNGNLSYSVDWGDGPIMYPTSNSSSASVQQSATFTHSYATAGTYTPTFTVTNTSGQRVQTSLSVNVGNATTPSITVLSPNGGESYKMGSAIPVSWTINYIPKAVYVMLSDYTSRKNVYVSSPIFPSTIGQNQWTIPVTAIDHEGKFKVMICDYNQQPSLCDTSDNYFTSVSSTSLLEATLDPSTPPAANVSPGQTNVPMLKIKLAATKGSAKMSGIQITARGANAASNFRNVTIWDGDTRIGGIDLSTTVLGPDSPTAVFPLSLTIPADTSISLAVTADIASSASGSGSFYVSGISIPNDANTDIAGFSIYGNTMNIVQPTKSKSSITVTLPRAGEMLTSGKQYTISWMGQNLPSDGSIYITIFNGSSAGAGPNTTIVSGLPITATSYTWTVTPNDGGWGLGMKDSWIDRLASLFVRKADAYGQWGDQYVITVSVNSASGYVWGASGAFTIVSETSTCSSTSDIVEQALGNPGGTGPFEKLGLDISAHPEILKYRIQWSSGGWTNWYVPGQGDEDTVKNLDGTSRRMWAYFDDHTHEYIRCNPAGAPVSRVNTQGGASLQASLLQTVQSMILDVLGKLTTLLKSSQ